jgi:hypothetical protein
MASARSGSRGARRSRRSRKTTPAEAPRGHFLSESHKRLLQIGSAAAAIGSVLALVFTVGDRVSGLFESDDGPGVRVDRVELEAMPLRTYLVTKEREKPPFHYTAKELDSDVLVVSFRARYKGSAAGVKFPFWLTLLERKNGRAVTVEEPLEGYHNMQKPDDECDCHEIFQLPPRGREYRAQVQIMDPEAPSPDSQPLAEAQSDWYRLPRPS